jgi:anti-anti-sigma factor
VALPATPKVRERCPEVADPIADFGADNDRSSTVRWTATNSAYRSIGVPVTTSTATAFARPKALPYGSLRSPLWVGRNARFAGRLLKSSVAVISADGEIDASNADALTEYTLMNVARYRGMVLDLRSLDFFGADGFSALHRVSVNCARVGTCWAIVPGAAASRVLRICDPQGSLPRADTVAAAIGTLPDQLHRPLRIVAAHTNTDG